MSIWVVIVLAVVQGVAEFLPISSSGHLAVLGRLFGIEEDANETLAILLHAGSLLAILVFYWKTLIGFLSPKQWHLAGMVILATIPAGVAGVGIKLLDISIFDNLAATGMLFLITATLLRMSEKPGLIVRRRGEENAPPTSLEKITFRQAVVVGVSQMLAILPGLSRSGTTISAGILCGVNREAAGTFSFLLAIPAIGGAALLEICKLLSGKVVSKLAISNMQLAVGFLISAVVSYGALWLLTGLIRRGRLAWFSWYLYVLGAAVVGWQLTLALRGR